MKPQTLLFLALLSWSLHADNSDNESNVVDVLAKGTYAEPANIEAPVYPQRALRRGIEGWVIVGFVTKEDGTTDEIEVLESSIDDYFDEAAIDATRARTYQPATVSGKPVMQGNMSVRYIFAISDSEGGVSRRFHGTFEKASKAIDYGDLATAKKLIDELDESKKRLLAEVCYLDLLKARYYSNMGDDKLTLQYVERALVIADTVATKEIYVNLLKQGIVDNAKINNFQDSLKHYEALLEVEDGVKADDPIHGFVSRIKEALDGPDTIQSTGAITLSCKSCESPGASFWRHTLNRSRFLIDQVNGKLSEIEIVCQNSTISVAYVPETAWSVNRDAGDCRITVFGDKDTTFRLVELSKETS